MAGAVLAQALQVEHPSYRARTRSAEVCRVATGPGLWPELWTYCRGRSRRGQPARAQVIGPAGLPVNDRKALYSLR